MVNYATAIPRFLWWGFKRASWIERAVVVTGLLLLLGLVWPADDSDAAVGSHAWSHQTPMFEFESTGWNSLGGNKSSYQSAIKDAFGSWKSDTDFRPFTSSYESGNDIHWGDDPDGWDGCEAPTGAGGSWGKECTRTSGGYIIESDIVFNKDKSWTTARLEGIAAHEVGHSGGLARDSGSAPGCSHTLTTRFTMCPTATATNAHWWASLEQHDIDDMNVLY